MRRGPLTEGWPSQVSRTVQQHASLCLWRLAYWFCLCTCNGPRRASAVCMITLAAHTKDCAFLHEAHLGLKPRTPPLLVLLQGLQTCGLAPAASKLYLLWYPAAWGMPHRSPLNLEQAGLGQEGSQHVEPLGLSAPARGFRCCFQVYTDGSELYAECRLILLATLLRSGQQIGWPRA